MISLSPTFYSIALLALFFLIVLYRSVVIVDGTKLAILERRWFGKSIPRGRVVALTNEVGIQARTLGPGIHLLIPFLYTVKKYPMLMISENEVGLVESIDGAPVPPGRIFARVNSEHNLFQDGEVFLKNGGEKGPQIEVLPPGNYRINPYLFTVEKVPVIDIRNDQIAVIVASDGEPISSGNLLAKHIENHHNFQDGQAFLNQGGQKGPQIDLLLPGSYRINTKLFKVTLTKATVIPPKNVGLVNAETGMPLDANEYIAKPIEGHKNFQDGATFLNQGGQHGPQLDFLKPGSYYINPLLFKVELYDVLTVERGEVAVIVSNIGKDPTKVDNAGVITEDSQNKPGIERYVVPSGYRGIQQEVLGPGTYYLNRLAYIPYTIPTTNITIDWATINSDPETNGSPLTLDPLTIVSRDGFEMTVEVKVIIRILPQQAPYMLARIGTVDNLINHVIHPLIDSFFRNQASSSEAMKFMQDRHEEQERVQDNVAIELNKYHVQCVSVLICQIILPTTLMDTLTSKVVATQQMAMFDAQQQAEGRRKEMEKTKAAANMQPDVVKAEIDVLIAQQQKQQQIILAEGKGQSTRLEQEGKAAGISAVGKAEAEKVLAIGQATANAYLQQVQAMGRESLAMIEIIKQVAEGKVKITPDILVQSGLSEKSDASANNVLAAFLASLLANKTHSGVEIAQPSESKSVTEEVF